MKAYEVLLILAIHRSDILIPEDHLSCKRSPDTVAKEVAEKMFGNNIYANDPVTGSGGDIPEMTLTSKHTYVVSSLIFHIVEYNSNRNFKFFSFSHNNA